MIRIILESGLWLRNTAAADADGGLSGVRRPDTGGSDALCLGPPLSQNNHSVQR
jgi:hypothetical protein